MPKHKSKAKQDQRQNYYSEYVYSTCDLVYRALNGGDGLEAADFVDLQKLLRPNKECVLHDFISDVVDFYESETFYDWPEEQMEASRSLVEEAGLKFPPASEQKIKSGSYVFDDKTIVYEAISEANKTILIPSVFHTLFSDRNFIIGFQRELRVVLKDRGSQLSDYLDKGGRIRRVYLPSWLKKAIFFRDRGMCQICARDVTGLKSPFDALHLDHIVPLADYGNNDPSNLQLVCEKCNTKKATSTNYERSQFIPFW